MMTRVCLTLYDERFEYNRIDSLEEMSFYKFDNIMFISIFKADFLHPIR